MSSDATSTSAEIWSPTSGASRAVAPLPAPRHDHRAVALGSGHVLVVGGREPEDVMLFAYHIEGDQWIVAGELLPPRFVESSTELTDGRVLVGGIDARGRSRVDLWDPPGMRAASTGQLAVARPGHAAIGLDDGRVLITGGWIYEGGRLTGVLASTELWDPVESRFAHGPALKAGRYHHQSVRLADGRAFVSGGVVEGAPEIETWTPGDESFTAVEAHGVAPRLHTVTLLADGRILLASGMTGERFGPAHIFEPDTGRVRATERLSRARFGHTATRLFDGRVLVAGGLGDDGNASATAEVWDPKSEVWSTAGVMVRPRAHHTATLLDDGRVLFVGGFAGPGG